MKPLVEVGDEISEEAALRMEKGRVRRRRERRPAPAVVDGQLTDEPSPPLSKAERLAFAIQLTGLGVMSMRSLNVVRQDIELELLRERHQRERDSWI